jgi:predicted anti-sigma-YlaC factor YlaD
MKLRHFMALLAVLALLSSCSIKKMAVNSMAKNMSGDATAVFMEDNDPELVGDAFPVILKMMDMMAATAPDNSAVRSSAGSMYVMYGSVYLQGKGAMLPYEEWEAQKELYDRAKKHYRRGYDYIMDALELKHKGFKAAFAEGNYDDAFAGFKKEDAADLYWGGAAVLAGVSVDVLDPNFAADRDGAVKMLFKALELDPDFGNGMLDEIMMQYYASMPEGMGGSMEKALYHYKHGVELSKDNMVSIHVSYASAICTKNQSQEGYDEFTAVLEDVLARDVESVKENRLANIISQRKAAWLLENRDDYFLFGF